VIRFIPRSLFPELKFPGPGGRWVSAIVGLEAVHQKKIFPYVGKAASDSLANHPAIWSLLRNYVFWDFQTVGRSLSRRRTFEFGLFEIVYS